MAVYPLQTVQFSHPINRNMWLLAAQTWQASFKAASITEYITAATTLKGLSLSSYFKQKMSYVEAYVIHCIVQNSYL